MSTLGLLLVVAAQAGSILNHYGDQAEAHYALCRRTEQETGADLQRIVGVWKACLAEAERLGLTSVLPAIRGDLALASAQLDAAREPGRTEEERLEAVLVSLARQRDVQFRLENLGGLYRRYLTSDRGRSRMASYRDIAFRWTNQASIDEGLGQLNEVVRRYVEDGGFRWADYGSQSAAVADVICRGTVRARVKEPSSDALSQLPVVETIIAIEGVRVARTGASMQGFLTTRSAQATTEQGALDASLHVAAEDMAASLLHMVIQAAFAGTVDVEDYLDPREDFDAGSTHEGR